MIGVMEIVSLFCYFGQGVRMILLMLIQVLGSIDCYCVSVCGVVGEVFEVGSFVRYVVFSLRFLIFSN